MPLKFQREGIKYDGFFEEEKNQWDSIFSRPLPVRSPLALAARDHSRYSRNRDQIEIAGADLAGRKEYFA